MLFGDDFGPEAVARWFAEERAYHDRFAGGRFHEHPALYRAFDWEIGLREWFRPRPGEAVLDFGCAEGDALAPWRAVFGFRHVGVDASQSLLEEARRRHPEAEFRLMPEDGRIPARDGEFRYAVVLGVLHHVPTVTQYLQELHRVLEPGGRLFLREPNHAMGREPGQGVVRPGISPNERGIPAAFLTERLQGLGFRLLAVRPAYHGALLYLINRRPLPADSPWWSWLARVDQWLCRIDRREVPYLRTRWWHKAAPTATYVVAEKR
ncbi:MAG: methyltransferase domain-containing protein [Firmicutes bacterium]|nr:methyltransferase domain-containing protein [Alicyclobacillaceae bacterium]MCL6497102.1 methyltransferase domain-containing protein [Bacillota bacterium]